MAEQEPPDQEPTGSGEVVRSSMQVKSRRSFSKLRRELNDDEMASAAVQRLLLDELDRLEQEVIDQNQYRDRFHTADKRASVLEEKLKLWQATDIAHALCLTGGSALIGYAPSLWERPPAGAVALAVGVVLVMGGIIAKVRAK